MFEYEFPVFVIARKFTRLTQPVPSMTFEELITLTGPNAPPALAMFTDQAAAEQFRDENFPGYQVLNVPTPDDLALVVQTARQVASHVALDPYRIDMEVQIATAEDILQQCKGHSGPKTPD